MQFKLKALGSLVVEGRDGPLVGSAAQRRTLALLVLIAASRERGVSRDKLIGLLWPDTTDERARHAFAQTLYRLRHEFGTEVVDGTDMLRLSPTAMSVDVAEFEDSLMRGELESAAALYGGPFLDGFFLPGAPEFERWMEEERARLSGVHRVLLERLATGGALAGAYTSAAEWWRSLAAVDPLNSRVAARFVEALVVAGDRNGALQYARVHEALVRQELEAEPGAEFVAAVVRARDEPRAKGVAPPAPPASVASARLDAAETPQPTTPTDVPESVFGHTSETLRVAIPRRRFRMGLALFGVAMVVISGFAYARFAAAARHDPPVIAVGHIADNTGGDSAAVARILPEMLTANLSRLSGLTVLSRTRLHELLVSRPGREPEGSDFANAAEQAGVDQLLDGALYRLRDGTLRLDLRVVDVRSGKVRQAHRAEASDAFGLADSATVRLALGFGLPLPGALRISDVTTSSIAAYLMYEEGLRALRQYDGESAKRLFELALAADSGFAMAAFGAYQSTNDRKYIELALRLADRATPFEGLTIRANWAIAASHPSQLAVAESLAWRFPFEPESHLLLANALHWRGDFPGALAAAHRAFAMDSLNARKSGPRCVACDALSRMLGAYAFMDSMAATERLARDAVARWPSSPQAWDMLRHALSRDSADALAAYARMRAVSSASLDDFEWLASLSIRTGDFQKTERLLAGILESGPVNKQGRALWWLAISQRYQGRLNDALATTVRMRRLDPNSFPSLLEGQVLFEMGRYGDAVAVFDKHVTFSQTYAPPGWRARNMTWTLTHKSAALAAAGDIAPLEEIADSMQVLGMQSGYGRDRLLHHHVRGLILAARGRKEEAVAEFRRAIWSPVAGYTRTNFELGRLLIELGRPREAVPLLNAALHGGLESTNLYVTHTELRALLSRAYAATNQPDSAAVHARWVQRATVAADPAVRAHIDRLLGPSTAGSR